MTMLFMEGIRPKRARKKRAGLNINMSIRRYWLVSMTIVSSS